MREGRVIVVTGTPGVGKSTVARLLAQRLGAELIELGDLVRREGLYSGIDPETGSLLVDTGLLADRVAKLVFSEPGKLFVIVGHYAQEVVPSDLLLMAFVLRREPRELKEVLASRGYSGRKLYENLQAEILDVCLYEAVEAYGPDRVYEVDVTGKRPEDVAEELLVALRTRRGRVGLVDWLGKLAEEESLEEFFPLDLP